MGTPAAGITSFANRFEPSNGAAAADGPNTEIPRVPDASATPATSGASRPTTTRSTSRKRASPSNTVRVVRGDQMTRGGALRSPGFPGAPWSSSSDADDASFHASAFCPTAPADEEDKSRESTSPTGAAYRASAASREAPVPTS